jgi:hypothetical protein
MARRREFNRVPRFEIADEDVRDEKYEVILWFGGAYRL